ncbi:MAG: hypothetical protein ACK47B_23855 [Armatimonadota bacterium]
MGAASFVAFSGTRSGVPIRRALSQTDVEDKIVLDVLDRMLEDLIRVHNPLWALLPRRPGSGPAANIKQRTARGAAGFVSDTEDPATVESSFGVPKNFPYKTILYPGKVTRRASAITRDQVDLVADEIESGVQDVRDVWENCVINGAVADDADSFDGLKTLTPAGQKVAMGANGAPLTLNKIDEAIDLCFGKPTFITLAQRVHRELNALLQAQQRWNDKVEVDGGFRLASYDGIPLVWTQWQSITEAKGTANNASTMRFVNVGKCYAEDLTPLTRMVLARTSSQFERFDIFLDTTLVLRNEKYISELNGITPG